MPGRGFVFVRLSVAKGQTQGENAPREKQPPSNRGDAPEQVAPGATGALRARRDRRRTNPRTTNP
jgi:hypothetical protein